MPAQALEFGVAFMIDGTWIARVCHVDVLVPCYLLLMATTRIRGCDELDGDLGDAGSGCFYVSCSEEPYTSLLFVLRHHRGLRLCTTLYWSSLRVFRCVMHYFREGLGM